MKQNSHIINALGLGLVFTVFISFFILNIDTGWSRHKGPRSSATTPAPAPVPTPVPLSPDQPHPQTSGDPTNQPSQPDPFAPQQSPDWGKCVKADGTILNMNMCTADPGSQLHCPTNVPHLVLEDGMWKCNNNEHFALKSNGNDLFACKSALLGIYSVSISNSGRCNLSASYPNLPDCAGRCLAGDAPDRCPNGYQAQGNTCIPIPPSPQPAPPNPAPHPSTTPWPTQPGWPAWPQPLPAAPKPYQPPMEVEGIMKCLDPGTRKITKVTGILGIKECPDGTILKTCPGNWFRGKRLESDFEKTICKLRKLPR